MRTFKPPTVAACAVLLGAGLLAACSSSTGSSTTTTTSATSATQSTAAGVVVADDAWIKTAPSDMTAVFGTLRNTTGQPVTVVSATTSASDHTELHEVVDKGGQMVMQPKAGGFAIPAQGSHVLKPGGDHIMVVDLKSAVQAGDVVTVTLTLDNGTKAGFTAVAKDTSAGQESYDSGGGMSTTSTGGMSMGTATP